MDPEDPVEGAREEISAHAEMFRERFLAAELALWAALISLAGIFISAASVVATIGKPSGFGWLLACIITSAFSMGLLIKNFQARRSMYRFLGQPPPDEVWNDANAFAAYVNLSKKKKQDTMKDQAQCALREKLVYGCLLMSGAFLVAGAYIARA